MDRLKPDMYVDDATLFIRRYRRQAAAKPNSRRMQIIRFGVAWGRHLGNQVAEQIGGSRVPAETRIGYAMWRQSRSSRNSAGVRPACRRMEARVPRLTTPCWGMTATRPCWSR
jgi:hypothetical protein